MFTISEKRKLAPKIYAFQIQAPQIAKTALPGQFVVLRLYSGGERIPLTIADQDPEAGTILIICQTFGKTSYLLNKMEAGEEILDLLGPLGTPLAVKNYGTVVLVGGGVGVPSILSKAKALTKAGNKVYSIIGAQRKELLILEEEMAANSHQLFVTTDDGSYGRKGFVTHALEDLLVAEEINLVISVGPVPMMKATVELCQKYHCPTLVSLNPIMVDGTGMCGCCRVSVAKETKFACVDGPIFPGEDVDFEQLQKRLRLYHDQEREAFEGVHQCQCER